jgi:hypothetical protein
LMASNFLFGFAGIVLPMTAACFLLRFIIK